MEWRSSAKPSSPTFLISCSAPARRFRRLHDGPPRTILTTAPSPAVVAATARRTRSSCGVITLSFHSGDAIPCEGPKHRNCAGDSRGRWFRPCPDGAARHGFAAGHSVGAANSNGGGSSRFDRCGLARGFAESGRTCQGARAACFRADSRSTVRRSAILLDSLLDLLHRSKPFKRTVECGSALSFMT